MPVNARGIGRGFFDPFGEHANLPTHLNDEEPRLGAVRISPMTIGRSDSRVRPTTSGARFVNGLLIDDLAREIPEAMLD